MFSAPKSREGEELSLHFERSVRNSFRVFRHYGKSDAPKQVGCEREDVSAVVKGLGVRVLGDQRWVVRSKRRDEGVLQARLVFDLFLKAGGRAGRMKQCCMTEAVVYLQRPSSRAFVLLPEPRGELVEVGQPRGLLVAVEVLLVEGRHLGHLIRHEFRASIARSGT